MYIKEAINNIREKNLEKMRENFEAGLVSKAMVKLQEKKIAIAQNYFGKK